MGKALGLPFVAALLHAAQPAAAACLPPDKVAERMDEYFDKPRGAATYRALSGLGDPRIEPFEYRDARFWSDDITVMMLIATALGIGSGFVGLLLSFHAELPAGPAIVLAAGGAYLASVAFGRSGGLVWLLWPGRHLEA